MPWRPNLFFWPYKIQGESRASGLNLCWQAGSSLWLHPLWGLGLPSHLQHCMFFLARIFDIPRLRSVPRITAEKFVLRTCLLFHASAFLGLHSPMIRSRLGHHIALSNLLPSTQLSGNKVQKVLLSSVGDLLQTESGLHLVHTQSGLNSKKQSQSDKAA